MKLNRVLLIILAVISATCFVAPAFAGPVGPGFQESGYQLVYDLSIVPTPNYQLNSVSYSVDNSSSIPAGSFGRIGYYLELQAGDGALQWVSVSMDAFTTDASKIGVPTLASGEIYEDVAATNMNISTSLTVTDVPTGTGLSGGYVQFWPDCYGTFSGPYATGNDVRSPGTNCYGSMQIGLGFGQTVFAYNAWDGGTGDLGIGNSGPSDGQTITDWTFATNVPNYTVRELQVFVEPTPEPASLALLATGLTGLLARRRKSKG